MNTQTPPRLGWTGIYVTNVKASIELYVEAFGLTVGFEHPGGDYAEFDTGTTALALIDRTLASDSTGLDLSAATLPSGNITLVVDHVHTAHQRAIAAGAASIAEPTMKPWGQTASYVADSDGNLVELATPVAAE